MPGRTYVNANGKYRYGFNGTEKDPEDGFNTTDYRQYDSRLGRWLSTDPVVKPWESPYAGFGNNPVWFKDPSGLDTVATTRTPGKAVNGQVLERTDSHGNKWFWIYEDGSGWIPQEGSGTLSTVVITADKATNRGEEKLEERKITQMDLFLAGVNVLERAAMGHASMSFGISIEGGKASKNPLAMPATRDAKLYVVDQEGVDLVFDLTGQYGRDSQHQRPSGTDSRNQKTGPSNGSKQQFFSEAPDQPALQNPNADDIKNGVQQNAYTAQPVVLTGEYQANDMSGNTYIKQVYSDGKIVYKMAWAGQIKVIEDPGNYSNFDWQKVK
jgi:RHS repeat-associated protein